MINKHEDDPPPDKLNNHIDQRDEEEEEEEEEDEVEKVNNEPSPEKHPRLCNSPISGCEEDDGSSIGWNRRESEGGGTNSPPPAPSSASSGFSDDDSLHCDVAGVAVTLEQFVKTVRLKGRKGLIDEYTEIRQRPPDGTYENGRLKVNFSKNRYTDVLCYDHSRVLLSQINNEEGSDYINANYVDGYKQKNAFISTQGPLPKTAGDFWRMVWEQHCLVIVMTTKAIERGRNKCFQYWETSEMSTATHGQFDVTTKQVDLQTDYTVSKLLLQNNKTEETREVYHFQYTSWPDYGTPSSALAMLDFLDRVRHQQSLMVSSLGDTWAGHPRGPPIVVHCSAGIGRTGTFCTIDICLSRLQDVGTIDVRGTVDKIRTQRCYSIQMPDQYIFCHLALIEYALSKKLIPPVDLTELEIADDDSE